MPFHGLSCPGPSGPVTEYLQLGAFSSPSLRHHGWSVLRLIRSKNINPSCRKSGEGLYHFRNTYFNTHIYIYIFLIEVTFMENKINHYKVQNSVAYSTFTTLYDHLVPGYYHYSNPQYNLHYPKPINVTPFSLPPTP